MLVDSHCHLDYYSEEEIEGIVARALEAGVGRLVTIGTTAAQATAVKALTERFPQVWGTVGVHPLHAAEAPIPTVEEIVTLADHPRIIGIGESGLDYFYDTSPHDVQRESFRRHIRACQRTGLPLAIHARDADDDIATILTEEREAGGGFPALLHCFSSTRKLAETVVAYGGYVSLSGILTFPKSGELRDIVADLPEDRLLVETDSPYLAPVPKRGKRNEPAWVAHTAAVLAKLRGWEVAKAVEITTANFERLFTRCR
ncbi:TatD family hydrolase [Roseomonas populi]|uniref:TatD family hydrolase n=1 Tax=Roseomonas populi TaxID=3121582 RepID=A0ABT1X000_9PROT|nr:TatD family hydrolase [Roseomonas pecuniae]MCR0981425.1 TatD family hydrolase [Roseomonas pecuniae]